MIYYSEWIKRSLNICDKQIFIERKTNNVFVRVRLQHFPKSHNKEIVTFESLLKIRKPNKSKQRKLQTNQLCASSFHDH